MRAVECGPHQGLQEQGAAARPTLGKGVCVPSEIGDRADSSQVGQAALHSPEYGLAAPRSGKAQADSPLDRAIRPLAVLGPILGIGCAQGQFPPRDKDRLQADVIDEGLEVNTTWSAA